MNTSRETILESDEELLSPRTLGKNLAQKVREQLGLLSLGMVINDDPVTPGPLITMNFREEYNGLDDTHPLVQDYHKLIATLDYNPIHLSELQGGLSIALTALLRVNGYKVSFVSGDDRNMQRIKVIKTENIEFLPRRYCIPRELPLLQTIHSIIDLIRIGLKNNNTA